MDGSARAATPPPSVLVSSLKRPRVSLATGRAPVGTLRCIELKGSIGRHQRHGREIGAIAADIASELASP